MNWLDSAYSVFPVLSPTSVVKAIAQFDINFARVVPVISAEGEAVVVLGAAVGDIQRSERCGETLAEILADCKIEGGVLRQIISRVWGAGKSVGEAGAVVNVGGNVGVAR